MEGIADFTLLEELSDARRGALWRARGADGREVVLRQIELPDDEARRAIEAAVADGLTDPRVVSPEALVVEDGTAWLVEPWIDGEELSTLLPPDSPLTLGQRLDLVHDVLIGLAYAHEHGLTHGNLSPRTIRVDADRSPTLVGSLIGDGTGVRGRRDAYASPEARTGQPRTPRSDVYSVAAVIEDLLDDPATEDAELTGRFTAALRPILDEARRSQPDERPENAQLLLDRVRTAITPLLADHQVIEAEADEDDDATTLIGRVPPVRRRPISRLMPIRAPWYRRPRWIAAAAATAVLLASGVGAYALNRSDEPTAGSTPTLAPSTPGTTSTLPSPSLSPTMPTPTPTPTAPTTTPPPAQLGFSGTYRYVAVVTKSVNGAAKKGSKTAVVWKVKTTCQAAECTTKVNPSKGKNFTLGTDLTTSSSTEANCVDLTTAKPTGVKVTMAYQRALTVKRSDKKQVITVVGQDSYRQLKKCPQQTSAKVEVLKQITVRLVKPKS